MRDPGAAHTPASSRRCMKKCPAGLDAQRSMFGGVGERKSSGPMPAVRDLVPNSQVVHASMMYSGYAWNRS